MNASVKVIGDISEKRGLKFPSETDAALLTSPTPKRAQVADSDDLSIIISYLEGHTKAVLIIRYAY